MDACAMCPNVTYAVATHTTYDSADPVFGGPWASSVSYADERNRLGSPALPRLLADEKCSSCATCHRDTSRFNHTSSKQVGRASCQRVARLHRMLHRWYSCSPGASALSIDAAECLSCSNPSPQELQIFAG